MEVALGIIQAAVTTKNPQSRIKARGLIVAAYKRAGSSNKATTGALATVGVELTCIIATISSTASRSFRVIMMMTMNMMIG